MFVMGAAIDSKSTFAVITEAKKVLNSLADSPITTAELESARNELIVELNNRQAKPVTMVDLWLDIDTFKAPTADAQILTLRELSPAKLQRIGQRLFRDAAIVSVVLGESQQLKSELEGRLAVEVMGEITKSTTIQPEVKTAPKPNTAGKP
jgi:predicted Zn-dependent peptidase